MSSWSEQESEKLRTEPRFCDTESFHSQYVLLGTIGRGGYAKVKLAQHRLTGTLVAVKMIHKREHWCHPVMTEVEILMMTNHPNIISLLQVIETEKRIYLIMELCKGKTLSQHIRESGHLQEDEARAIFKQILNAVGYCHDQGIVHRDLKTNNIMIERNGRVKVIDFGFSTQVKPNQILRYHCGTHVFSAPEIHLGRLYDGPKADVWTLGVVLYYMTTGRIPFDAVNIPHLKKQVVSGKYLVPSSLSIELQGLLSLLLSVNPQNRPSIAEVMRHPWLKEDSEGLSVPREELIPLRPDPTIIKAMRYIGFQAQDIKDSLHQRKYNETMASYCLLKRQALQECDIPTRAQPLNPLMTPFPSLVDLTTFPLGLRRRESEPTLLRSSSHRQVSVYGQKANKRRDRRFTWPDVLLCRPLQTTPTMGQVHAFSASVPCIYSMPCREETSISSESNKDNSRASAEDKPVPSRGRPRGIKGWAKMVGNAMRKLCFCIPSTKKSSLGQNRVSPQQ